MGTPAGFPLASLGDGGGRTLTLASSGMVPEHPSRRHDHGHHRDAHPESRRQLGRHAHHAAHALVPNARKAKDSEPDYRIVSRENGFELGAGWNRRSKNTGDDYISVSLSAPEFGSVFGNVAPAPGDDPTKKVIIWNPAN
jgi:uncharacterized protein (DUF736 family)